MSSPVAPTLTASNVTPIDTPTTGATLEGLDHWLKDLQKYEAILVSTRPSLKTNNKLILPLQIGGDGESLG